MNPSHDWVRSDGTRIEVKSAQLSHNSRSMNWAFHFTGVHIQHFDYLWLVCYTPYGLYIGEWNGLGLTNCGRIVARSKKGDDWHAALRFILNHRFPGTLHAFMPWPGIRV